MQANVAIPGQSNFFLYLPAVDAFLPVSGYPSPPLEYSGYLKSLGTLFFPYDFNIYVSIFICPFCNNTVWLLTALFLPTPPSLVHSLCCSPSSTFSAFWSSS